MAVEQESNNSAYSGPPIDRNGFHYILSQDLLFYLFGGLYTRIIAAGNHVRIPGCCRQAVSIKSCHMFLSSN